MTWLDTFNAALMAIQGYAEAVRDQRITFSLDEYNRLCDVVRNAWANKSQPQPPAPVP